MMFSFDHHIQAFVALTCDRHANVADFSKLKDSVSAIKVENYKRPLLDRRQTTLRPKNQCSPLEAE